ncbi:MAG: hypothetical protein JWR37_326 [Mycobacterium sp.]|nr:hypothetical protein [Mycobacterium sp.]
MGGDQWLGASFVAGVTVGTAALLHLRLENVPLAALQFVPNSPIVLPEERPVAVVELLDDLKGPPPVQDVAAHHLGFQLIRNGVVARGPQLLARLTEQQIRMPHQLME